ncbi:endonuclease MutS2 [Bacillus salitolerans]|uniref:Endonuclease MutS2 n=1 Tax=Bacillus salitolerans TaxID=1437434 RepID=A0ABW4LT19_9BACI
MDTKTIQTLQFDEIKKRLAEYAMSDMAKEQIQSLYPSTNKNQITNWLEEVTEAKAVLTNTTSIPISSLTGIGNALKNINKGVALRPDQLKEIFNLIDCADKLRRFMKDKEYLAPKISTFIYSLHDLSVLGEEISRCIRNGQVDDYASKELLKIRKQISILQTRLKEKVDHVVKSSKYNKYLQENVVSLRNGRYAIPIKKEYRKQINGVVLDTSASGSTVYMEPEELGSIQDEINYVKYDEEAEEQNILLYLTGLVEKYEHELKIAVDTLVYYDLVFAKGKYSLAIEGQSVRINEHHTIKLKNAKHPLLGKEAIPLTIIIGEEFDALLITGPNTGGKTVTMKTVGLLTIMAMSGLHVPVETGSELAIFQEVLVDIGDGQSIEESLSTFSSRIKNVIDILSKATPQTLVLLDELGSGTDPAEGMGLATSILEELYKKGATILATTHYSEIKEYAMTTEGFQNASMEFDIETLRPTYRLIIGESGTSQAFSIALKLGMHPKIIERAHAITYKEEKNYDEETTYSIHQLNKQLGFNNKHIRKQKHLMKEKRLTQHTESKFNVGDNVKIPFMNEYGIVYKPEDKDGNVIVVIKGVKKIINQKRLELYIKAEELYPEEYEMDIVFESKDNRKKDKLLNKGHVEGLTIEREK